jgi:tetratricopeptide (TPR) repeat protein
MKKIILTLVLALALGTLLSAQYKSAHYEVITPPGNADGAAYANEMELRMEAYNRVFRFNPAALPGLLRLRIFTDQREYDEYVSSKLGSTKAGAVYLHYNNPAGRELVIHRGSAEEEQVLAHQAFVQFLRAFIPQPPSWIREGFAVHFNTLRYNRERGALEFEENVSWLETVKRASLSPDAVLLADKNGIPPNFPAYSWSLVSFFINGGNSQTGADTERSDYYRALTDSIMLLSPSASAEENAQAVYNRIVLFTNPRDLSRDYNSYIASKKSFTELVDEGQRAYGSGNFSASAELFRRAAALRPRHYAPQYYLGLLAYEEKKYAEAEGFYKTALEYGAERALVQYARGVNAVASGKKTEALAYLQEASAADPAAYKARVDELVGKLE